MPNERESDKKVKQKLAEKKGTKKEVKHQIWMVRDISKGRYLLRWHTGLLQRPIHHIYLKVFFFFLISVAYNVNKQGKLLYVAVTA